MNNEKYFSQNPNIFLATQIALIRWDIEKYLLLRLHIIHPTSYHFGSKYLMGRSSVVC